MKFYIANSTIIILTLFTSCQLTPSASEKPDNVIAAVGNKSLYTNELANIIHPSTNSHDSSAIATAYIDQWVRDQLLMQEASRFFSSDFEIENLVEDYRNKLVKFNFEEKIIGERFDTIITEAEINNFYEENKEQFILDHPILRCIYAAVPEEAKGVDRFNSTWLKNDEVGIETYVTEFATDFDLDPSNWVAWSQINEWSSGQFSEKRAKTRKDQQKNVGDRELFLKVVEFRGEKEISPLDYIKDRLKLMILHERKQSVLEDYKQELYDRAIDNNQIKI